MQGPNDALPFKLNDDPVRKEHSFPAAYQLTHVATGDVYVGSTHDLYTRINKHRTGLSVGEHRNHKLQSAHDTSPEFRVHYLPTNTREEALDLEQSLLDDLRQCDHVLNIAMDARKSGLGVIRSESTREKLREINRRQFSSEEARQRHSEITRSKFEDPEYRARHIAIAAERRGVPIEYNGVSYPSIKGAARELGILEGTLRYRLKKSTQKESKS